MAQNIQARLAVGTSECGGKKTMFKMTVKDQLAPGKALSGDNDMDMYDYNHVFKACLRKPAGR